MKLFGQLVGTLVETVKIPVTIVADILMWPIDIHEERDIAHRTMEQLDKIKDAAKEKP